MKHISNISSRIRARFAGEQGFTMIPAIMAVMVGSLLSLGAWSAAHSDVSLQNSDHWTKVAYTQAESGVSDYVQHMAEDAGYWQYCDSPPGPGGTTLGIGTTAINDTDKSGTTGTNARRWLPQPAIGSAADANLTAQYTIDLIPENGQPSCDARSDRNESMVDKTTGVIRIRVTGRAGPPVPATSTISTWRATKWRRRSIVIEFRRKGFLDYAYFTDKEGKDPSIQPSPQNVNCATYYSPIGASANTTARFYYNGNNSARPECGEITFSNADHVNGPFHSNDAVSIASSGTSGPTFGNVGKNDVTEVFDAKCPFRTDVHSIPATVTDSATGNDGSNKCTATPGSVKPNITGTLRIGAAAGYLPLPESNQDLLLYADDNSTDPDYHGYTYTGPTTILLKPGGLMDVTNGGTTETDKPYPPSGVVYVKSPVASCPYDSSTNYPSLPPGCGYVEVSGTYDTPLTITSEADVVVTGDLVRATGADTAVLGLIGNNFVRIRHYAAAGQCSNLTNTSSNATVHRVDAAILALNHSFTVDRFDCGSGLGTLTLNGVLAQQYRGIVNSGGGYTKDYNYDYRYKYLTPPHFLVPTLSNWRISRYREQVPACTCT
jgi:hypothetical protein